MGRPSTDVDGARRTKTYALDEGLDKNFVPGRGHRPDNPLKASQPRSNPREQLSINGRLTIVAAFKYVVHSLPAPSIQNPANHGQCTSSNLPQECCRQSKQCLYHFNPGRRGGLGPSLHRPCVHLVPAVAS